MESVRKVYCPECKGVTEAHMDIKNLICDKYHNLGSDPKFWCNNPDEYNETIIRDKDFKINELIIERDALKTKIDMWVNRVKSLETSYNELWNRENNLKKLYNDLITEIKSQYSSKK